MASSDLAFLLEANAVDEEFKKALVDAGITTVAQFGSLVETSAELRDLLKIEFKLDGSGGLAAKARIAKIVVAWDTAKKRTEKKAEVDVENSVRNLPKLLANSDFVGMRNAYESKYQALEEDEVPARQYMERRLDAVEKDDLKAEPLSEVFNIRQDENETLKPIWDNTGNLKAV